ncbi:protein AATF-like [Clytia hemisphaerica]|uniref:Protein AATF n=1 Tax=Clytia hemisphaerica TaxID=252671 RepID=A0A7M6DPR6_9CNID
MATKKSLRDSLKELENPASAINFEDSDDELTAAKITELTDEDTDLADVKSFGNLRKKAFQNDEVEPKYSGNKISRKNIEQWSDDGESEDESIEEDEANMSDASGNDNESDSAENSLADDDDNEENKESGNEEQEENEESLSEYEDDDGDFEDGDDGMMNLDLSKIPKELLREDQATLIADEDEEEDINNFMAINQSSEKRKGEATRSQLDILDKLLESRIRLQKSMQVTNTLPQNNQMKNFLKEGGPQIQEAHREAKASLTGMLNNLLKLQEKLFKATNETKKLLSSESTADDAKKRKKKKIDEDEEIPSDTDDEANKSDESEIESESDAENSTEEGNVLNLPSKRKSNLSLDDYEEELSKRHKAFCGYRDTTILKWYDKTRLMTGKMNKGFSAFETSTLQQIKQVLSDKNRLMKRCQLKRTQYKILGKSEEEANPAEEVDSHLTNYDAEIFDDSDFYHEMLKELIERKSNLTNGNEDDPIASGRRWLELQKLRTKTKRKVDTRASKGRKVRYDIHSKLVSFMAPQEIGSMSDQARNDLFSSLFGGMVNNDVIGR